MTIEIHKPELEALTIERLRSGAFETIEEKQINRGITSDELGRVQVPTLIEAVPERVKIIVERQAPGSVHCLAVLA